MNGQHLRAFLWLRWRLRVNQLKRGGTLNVVLFAALAIGAVLLAAFLFVVSLLVGLFAFPRASPAVILYVWDGVVLVFLFFWAIGLVIDLQRPESLALQKFLHLPVSLTSAFLINYLSSLLSLTLILFVPAMVGICLALVFAKGAAMLLLLPLLAAFLLTVTALTHQFQGWLAAIMANPRRRRTVIILVPFAFILITQLPNLLMTFFQTWNMQPQREFAAWLIRERQDEFQRSDEKIAEFRRSRSLGKITAAQYVQRREEVRREFRRRFTELNRTYQARTEESERQTARQVEQTTRLVHLLLPPGWLSLGARGLAEGNLLPALLGALGLTLIGTASLWRSYRTTLRLYTGRFTSGKRRPAAVVPPPQTEKAPARFLEKDLPWLSEQTSAVALAGFRSLVRAPEAKMLLLTPLMLMMLFSSTFFAWRTPLPEGVRPLMAFGAMALILFSSAQFVGNQFGFDRGGFRVFVLCAAPRRDILLGKNLAFAPVPLALGGLTVAVLQAVYPMRWDHFLAALPQWVSMYLLFCLLANCLSILAPMPVASGSLKPAHMKGIALLFQLAFTFLLPLVWLPTLLPLGMELGLEALGWTKGIPVFLVLSLLECVAVVYLYRLALTRQGPWLQAREQAILKTVTAKAE